jgi:threonine/homoserine/homoserine lactone efflux protein
MIGMAQTLMLWLSIGLLLVTPGPTNTLLATAGCRRGVRSAAPLTMAELGGYLIAIALWGCLIVRMADQFSWLPKLLRVGSALYLAVLAWRMWRTAASDAHEHGGASMRDLFVATLLNPKAMLFAGTILPPAAFVDLPAYARTMAIFTSALVPIGLLWIACGAALGAGRLGWLTPLRVQRAGALVLCAFALALLRTL